MTTSLRDYTEPNVAVLIDYENVDVDTLPVLFDQLTDVGRMIVRRAYADWSTVRTAAKDQLIELGIEAIQNFHSAGSAKNSADIRLAIDAVDLLYSSPVAVFVIVSSDSDFVSLISKLRAGGKSVIGAGRKTAVSQTLVKSCDRYIYLERPPKAPEAARSPLQGEVPDLLLRAFQASSDEEGKVVAAKLHNIMRRIDPSFDFKVLGFSSFKKFLQADKRFKVSKPSAKGDMLVELQ